MNNCYIGETGRDLKERVQEHLRKVEVGKIYDENCSAIAQHSMLSQPDPKEWTFKVLVSNLNNAQNRKVVEALAISRFKPTLNRDKGVHTIANQFHRIRMDNL